MKNILLIVLTFYVTTVFSQENINPNSEKPVEFVMLQNPPVYLGCENFKSASSKNICSNEKLMDHIYDNFDGSVLTNTDLDEGNYEVKIVFIVNKEGKVGQIETEGSEYPAFVKEATRLVKSIPNYLSPGIQKGKIINVRYTIPIIFTVQKN